MNFNLDKIVKEWSYRVHDGIPDIKNSLHMAQLRELLREYKITENVIDMLINNLSGEKKKINEIATRANQNQIDRIIQVLKGPPYKLFDNVILDKIENLVNRDSDIEKSIIDLIVKSGIPSNKAEEISDKALSYPGAEKFANYLKKRSLTLKSINGKTISSVLSKTGIDNNFLSWLIQYTWPASPSIGRGEVALALLLKNGTKAADKGDIKVGGIEVEVKGAGGRLKGQHGYGTGLAGAQAFETELKKLAKKLPKEIALKNNIPPSGGTEYNPTGNNWAIDRIGSEMILVSKGKITSTDIVKVWKKGLNAVFLNMNTGWIKSHIDNAGKIKNRDKFVKDFGINTIEYYMSQEGFGAIALLHPSSGKMALVTDPKNAYSSIKIKAPPSFSAKAGSQGATFAIDVK